VTAVNRQQIANNLFRPIVNKLPVLQSVMYKPFEGKYRNNWGGRNGIAFSQRNAIKILRDNNCTGGPATPRAGNRDIYSCPEVGKLEFRYTTNLGVNERRALAFQIIRQQLLSVGIQINADPVPGLQPRLSGSNWDIFNFAWVGSPTSALTYVNVYGCGRPQNFKQYCNQQVTRILDQVTSTVDEARQTALLNQVDRILARDIPTLPLYAAPGFAIHRTNVRGVLRNPTNASLFWNAGAWYLQ
jgi:peptide/nickel transport system substrate-binding protein